ncbi:MAG: enoyl-CoA hydratase/isomerase [Proteobacteria bacterium]|jgi:2-(1,2-epoxy-1,2-dihydrophenyl)acetyl-CoA isomerase|nr:enoyl-CoA hydratase/isomerase [Pseudomonadota bacterium]MDA1299610.1 enoyl-CoA hydratase/isomerase [Pseudomonadota bacterium]
MEYEKIELDQVGNVAVLKFNAPAVLNAISIDMVGELSHAVRSIAAGDARCLLLTGVGRGFCAGANLQGRGESGSGSAMATAGSALESHYHPLINQLRNLDIPMVTAVNGPAVGVGMSFAIMADLVVAARSAYFMQAFARIGLVPDGGSTYYLPRMIGWNRALELSLLAERLPAQQALEWGLVNRVVEDEELMTEAMALAERLANGPKSLGLIRRLYWESPNNSFEEQLQLEANLQAAAGATEDNREGVRAFLEKRDAEFKGR